MRCIISNFREILTLDKKFLKKFKLIFRKRLRFRKNFEKKKFENNTRKKRKLGKKWEKIFEKV